MSNLSSTSRASRYRMVLPGPAVVVAVVVLLLAPMFVATAVTSPLQPQSYLRAPWRGWVFVAEVVTAAPAAEAASPGAALRVAQQQWSSDSGFRPTAAQLVHVDTTVPLAVPIGTSRQRTHIAPGSALAWIIEGTTLRSSANVVVGVIDYETGAVRYDLRDHQLPSDESDTP